METLVGIVNLRSFRRPSKETRGGKHAMDVGRDCVSSCEPANWMIVQAYLRVFKLWVD